MLTRLPHTAGRSAADNRSFQERTQRHGIDLGLGRHGVRGADLRRGDRAERGRRRGGGAGCAAGGDVLPDGGRHDLPVVRRDGGHAAQRHRGRAVQTAAAGAAAVVPASVARCTDARRAEHEREREPARARQRSDAGRRARRTGDGARAPGQQSQRRAVPAGGAQHGVDPAAAGHDRRGARGGGRGRAVRYSA